MARSSKIAVWVIVGIILVSAGLLAVREDEGTWVCTQDGWVRHGNPSVGMPTEVCPDERPEPAFWYSPAAHANKIRVTSPTSSSVVASPLSVAGEARGTWYFEGSFPVELRDALGNTIAQAPATAQGEWMTETFVLFSATIAFPAQPAGSAGTLVLRKDNPSGEPRFDDEIRIPVRF